MWTGCFRMIKSCHICINWLKEAFCSLPNVITSLVDFVTAYKKLWRLCAVAESSDSKNPKLYYCLFKHAHTPLPGRGAERWQLKQDNFIERVTKMDIKTTNRKYVLKYTASHTLFETVLSTVSSLYVNVINTCQSIFSL